MIGWKTATAALGLLVAGSSAIVGVPPAWTALGLPDATKTWTLAQLKPMAEAQNATTRAVDQLLLNQLKSSLYQAKRDKEAAPSTTVDQRIEDIKQEIDRIQTKLNNGS